MKNFFIQCFVTFLVLSLSIRVVFAFEEEHEAHEHGHATLMLVQEENELQLLFKSPAMNITGFEHEASTPEQLAKIEWARESLSDALRLFMLSPEANCVLEHINIESALLTSKHHSGEHDSHAKHETSIEKKDSHSEFEAEYHFECKNIGALKEIKVALFEIFTSLEEIEMQIINDAGQMFQELDRNNTSIKL